MISWFAADARPIDVDQTNVLAWNPWLLNLNARHAGRHRRLFLAREFIRGLLHLLDRPWLCARSFPKNLGDLAGASGQLVDKR